MLIFILTFFPSIFEFFLNRSFGDITISILGKSISWLFGALYSLLRSVLKIWKYFFINLWLGWSHVTLIRFRSLIFRSWTLIASKIWISVFILILPTVSNFEIIFVSNVWTSWDRWLGHVNRSISIIITWTRTSVDLTVSLFSNSTWT